MGSKPETEVVRRLTRRGLIGAAAAAPFAGHLRAAPAWKLGVMDGVLGLASKPEAVAAAARLGLQGLQVTLGQTPKGSPMQLAVGDLQAAFVEESKKHNVPLVATYLDALHISCLKSDPYARDRVLQGIDITKRLGARILMTVFFGKCALDMRNDTENTIAVFSDLAPAAERAGVVLGFENLLSASANEKIHDAVNSPAFKIYYDVGNARNMTDADPAEDLRRLGAGRICQVHLKDRGYLGEGKVNFPAIWRALLDIGYKGYAVLETSAPSRNIEADLKRNIDYLNGLG